MPIRAVGFDVDGTLYPNRVMYLRSFGFVARRLRLMRAYAAVRREIRRIRPIEDFDALEAELLAKRLRVSEELARERIEREIYGVWESVLDRVPLYAGVRDCVERIRARGLRLAVSSDFPVRAKIQRLGLGGLFDCELWTQESGYLKPHPEPFDALCRCLGTDPSETLYVGNSYHYDIMGAKAFGMRAAHIARHAPAGSVADLTFSDYDDLCDYVSRNA